MITNSYRFALCRARTLLGPGLHRAGRNVKCYVGATILEGLHRTYADVEDGEPVAVVGSSGYLEVGVYGGDAARLLSIQKGSAGNVVFVDRE